MSEPNLPEKSKEKLAEAVTSPWNCLLGALISTGFAIALYFLTSSIVSTFAEKPLTTTNPTAINIAVAVRTLVMGSATLATGVFTLIAVGLFALAIQSAIQQIKASS